MIKYFPKVKPLSLGHIFLEFGHVLERRRKMVSRLISTINFTEDTLIVNS